MYIKRDFQKTVAELSKEYSCILITGPRQIGKSTMLREMDSKRHYVTLDDLEERKLAKTDPALFLQTHELPITIDEVQYAPELFSYIKIAVDNGAVPGSFWMTGSQMFRLMDLAKESLAGRTAILQMSALSQHEIFGTKENEPFLIDLESLKKRKNERKEADVHEVYRRIWQGSLPGLVSGKYTNREVFYSSYLQTYIERDISDMTEKINKLLFVDFIRAAACRTAQLLNLHDIAKDVGISDDTAKRWIKLLEQSGIIFFLRPYSNNLTKRVVKTPKLYFFDTGLVAYLTKHYSSEILENGAINGAILENYVICEIRKTFMNEAKECDLYFYRDKEGNEIDVVMAIDGLLHPIEIKKIVNPASELTVKFKVIDNFQRGKGAVVCMRRDLTAVDVNNFIVPVWLI